jgi:organic hydroperoxide reductase OsmC/OhrA
MHRRTRGRALAGNIQVLGHSSGFDVQVALPREELFAAGYAACFRSAVKRVAADKKSRAASRPPNRMSGSVPRTTVLVFTITAELHVSLPGADVETPTEVVREPHDLPLFQRDAQQH